MRRCVGGGRRVTSALQLSDLTKSFGDVLAFDDVRASWWGRTP